MQKDENGITLTIHIPQTRNKFRSLFAEDVQTHGKVVSVAERTTQRSLKSYG